MQPSAQSGPLIVIQQMGKVASQAVEATIKALRPDAQVRRDHGLTQAFSRDLTAIAERGRARGDLVPDHIESLLFQASYAERSRALLEGALERGRPTVVITGFRDPLAFIVSNAFQLLSAPLPAYPALLARRPRAEPALRALTVELCQLVAEQALQDEEQSATAVEMLVAMTRQRVLQWWQREWLDFHGLAPEACRRQEDALIWRAAQGPCRYLLYRLEDGPAALREVVAEATGAPCAALKSVNKGADKDYGELYRAVTAAIAFPSAIVEAYFASDYVTALYGPEEQERLKQGWLVSNSC